MRKLILFGILTMSSAAIPAKAQVVVDMSLITCKQYAGVHQDRSR